MFEITLFLLFLIDSVQWIARYYRKWICPGWAKHTLWATIPKNIKATNFQTHLMGYNFQKYKSNKFLCLNLICFFCMYFRQLRTHHVMGLLQTINKGYWRNFGFFVPFGTVLASFFGEGCVFGFQIIKCFRYATTFFFRATWAWE